MKMKLVATDLDGTILPRLGTFNELDLAVLTELGREGVIRVVATGRTFSSALQALPEDFPIDYLVFSSGAGVFNWKTRELMQSLHLDSGQATTVMDYLSENGWGFTLHDTIPNNHKFWFVPPVESHPDFERFLAFNAHNGVPFEPLLSQDRYYCQLLAFLSKPEDVEVVCNSLKGIKSVRATSPIDGESVWIEFFHPDVSKASGILLVCKHENIGEEEVCVLGNDFNDLDMLTCFHPNSFVVENAPAELRARFSVVPPVNACGLSHMVQQQRDAAL
jgi:HAD superfamily hydrolase (TIGR01484 family)